jgi:hypothetical protein
LVDGEQGHFYCCSSSEAVQPKEVESIAQSLLGPQVDRLFLERLWLFCRQVGFELTNPLENLEILPLP